MKAVISIGAAALRRLASRPWGIAGLAVGAVLAVLAFFGSALAPHDPLTVRMDLRLLPSSWTYPLGTDALGRCLLSRLLVGAQTTLGLAGLVIVAVLLIGVPLGLLAGYAGGRVDAFLMRIVDGLSTLPDFLLVIAISGFLGPSQVHLIVAIVAINWIGYARIVRGVVLSEREKDYVAAAIVSGCKPAALLRRHLLPSVLSPVLVYAALDIGKTILVVSSLSFLGLGAQPPSPEWGAMLNDGRAYFQTAPQLMVYPGLAIMLVVIAFNLMGEGLRSRLDQRYSERRSFDDGSSGSNRLAGRTMHRRRTGKPREGNRS
ncbi:nickel transporter permease [Paenibacillus pasadenensis]|uniref:nickel transporter permease n=1 Tax=Paenibacillus TaxID=44249 RepID=UPI00041D5FD5|nr:MULTISPECIES: nickel transporter permease [Paenibacillus]QGG55220.1 ABC transporter permease subunit [Paenibacillus sp. B01]